jgi:hypothetical protein
MDFNNDYDLVGWCLAMEQIIFIARHQESRKTHIYSTGYYILDR